MEAMRGLILTILTDLFGESWKKSTLFVKLSLNWRLFRLAKERVDLKRAKRMMKTSFNE